MTELILASILVPFAGGLAILVLPPELDQALQRRSRLPVGRGRHCSIGPVHDGRQDLRNDRPALHRATG